jgi:MoaA/NifB/PqqE/SkfB family radical SAM enzyme
MEWMKIPRVRVAVSVDGLPEHHDIRRKPATYDRILKNIKGREVNIHWVITRPMLERSNYIEEYLQFWNARPEVNRIWVSFYTPQLGEQSPERLTPRDREFVSRELQDLLPRYPKLLMKKGIAASFVRPPANPDDCLFAKMSANFSADLRSQVEPCVFGGTPDCSQCGCAISTGLHWIRTINIAGPVKIEHVLKSSLKVGLWIDQFRSESTGLPRWMHKKRAPSVTSDLVQIDINGAR